MSKIKFVFTIFFTFFIVVSCSLVTKIKEMISSDDNGVKILETTEGGLSSDVEYYNKYIEISNNIRQISDNIYTSYVNSIRDPKSLKKDDFVSAVAFGNYAGKLESSYKEYNRSMFDGGELSKLTASENMKKEIEDNFKELLKEMKDFYVISAKVSDYYNNKEYKNDISKAVEYDEEFKTAYEKFNSVFNKFNQSIKKYKPKRKIRDLQSLKAPIQKSMAALLNSYEGTIEPAEEFYDEFSTLKYKDDYSKAKEKINKYAENLNKEKNVVPSIEFTDATKHMKYNYEDHFVKTSEEFIKSANTLFEKEPSIKSEAEYNQLYNDVVNSYNSMIYIYNANTQAINTFTTY